MGAVVSFVIEMIVYVIIILQPRPPSSCLNLQCPGPVSIVADPGNTTAIVTWANPKCDCCKRLDPKIYQSGRDVNRGDVVGHGAYQAHYWAADDSGRNMKCSFKVNVHVIECDELPVPPNGGLTCSHGNLLGSMCRYSCDEGYRVQGLETVTCERYAMVGTWSAISNCTIVTCPAGETTLPPVANGTLTCDGNNYGHTCEYQCNENYTIPRSQQSTEWIERQCTAMGNWTEGNTPECKEKVPPRMLNCSRGLNITTTTLQGSLVTIPKPLFIGSNDAIIAPDCGKFSLQDSYQLSIGQHVVQCRATDPELDTTATCTYTIRVLPNDCANLPKPEYGAMSCASWLFGILCQMSCQTGFDIAPQGGFFTGQFLCLADGSWSSSTVPDCSPSNNPNGINLPSELYYFVGECMNNTVQQQIRENFIQILNSSSTFSSLCRDYGDQCAAQNVAVSCGPRAVRMRRGTSYTYMLSRPERRIREARSQRLAVSIEFDIVISLPAEVDLTDQTAYNLAYEDAEIRLFAVFDGIDSELKAGNISLESEFPEYNLTLSTDSFVNGRQSLVCEDGQVANRKARKCVDCPVGHSFDSTAKTCIMCTVGLYQDKEGQLNCSRCPFGMNTTRPGSKSIEDCEETDECLSDPCRNNGTCVDSRGTFTCICAPGYTGRTCSIHDCAVINKCKNNGTCVGFESGYNCTCLEEYSGQLCEHKKVHAQFTQWSTWSECTQSCDSGLQHRIRSCSNPTPMFGGRPCEGNREETRTCNTEQCPACSPVTLTRPIGGSVTCQLHEDGEHMICEAKCNFGHGFGSPVPENGTYICGPNTSWVWPHQSSDNRRAIIPRCTKQATATKNFVWLNKYPNSDCDDPNAVNAVRDKIETTSNHMTNPLDCRHSGVCGEPLVYVGCPPPAIRRRHEEDEDNSIVVNIIIQVNSTEQDYINIISEMNTIAANVDDHIQHGSLSVTINGTTLSPSENATYGNIDSCPIGSVLAYDGSFCVLCRAGTYYTQNANNNSEIACRLCDRGYYQPHEGQTECISCPEGMITDERGSSDVTDCFIDKPKPHCKDAFSMSNRHAQFTQWSTWSHCTKSCDSGLQHRIRSCSNPTPMLGGRPCEGNREETRTCNTEQCPDHHEAQFCDSYCIRYTVIPGSNCARFHQEVIGSNPPTGYDLPCPTGLQFNTANCMCDWPRNVQCLN